MNKSLFGGVRMVSHPDPDNVRKLDMGCVPMVLEMQRRGILVDTGYLAEFSVELQRDMERLTEEMRSMTGYYLNMGSPDQVADLLFNKLKIRPGHHAKKTPMGKRYVVAREYLESISPEHPCIPMILDYGEVKKIKESYCDVLPTLVGRDGRIRTTLRITRIVSGRISSSRPNLTAQPTRSELGKRIRKAFVASRGRVMLVLDLSQIEMRTMAHEASCLAMIDTFSRGGDIHLETASRMFGLPPEKLDKMEHRYPAKRVGFGVMFLITPQGLLIQMTISGARGWTEQRCADMISLWYGQYPEVRSFQGSQKSDVLRWGMVWDMWGRHRLLPAVKCVVRRVKEEALRAACNHRIQSGAQGIIKLQMAEIQDTRDRFYGDAVWPLLQIHDELLFEVQESAADEFTSVAGDIMARAVPEFLVPIKWAGACGPSWGDLDK
jgi:DNA polymerase-1